MLVRLLLALLLMLASGCTQGAADRTVPATMGDFALPFGLEQVAGTESLGRPAVYEASRAEFNGMPYPMTSLAAAYRVTADDPVDVFRQWLAQLVALNLDTLSARPGDAPGPWLRAEGFGSSRPGQPPTGSAELTLWATTDGPVLLVFIQQRPGATGGGSVSLPGVPDAPEPSTPAQARAASAGDVVLQEQGDEIRVPEGARTLLAALPTPRGTGGSTSVLAAVDADAAVRALLAEAQSVNPSGEVQEPAESVQDGADVIQASFTIPAGGWGFDVVTVRGPDDPSATVWVTSFAD